MTQVSQNQGDASRSGAANVAEVYAMETSVDALLWRSTLSHAPEVPNVLDQVRLVQLCHDAKLAASARMLDQVICLQLGFSPSSRALKVALTRLACEPDLARSLPQVFGAEFGTVERAIDELQHLAHHLALLLTIPVQKFSEAGSASPSFDQGEPESRNETLAVIVDDLFAFLHESLPQGALDKAGPNFAAIQQRNMGLGEVAYRSFASAPLPLLAAAMAAASLREYLVLADDFIFGPLGSAALLHAVARFDEAGLGPYFSNVPRLVRGSRDVFELAQIAQVAGCAAGAVTTREQWVVLLSARLTGSLRDEVVDDLGDIGATAALAAIFDRAVRQPDHRVDVSLIMRIRDAALDNADFDLGARAQASLARLFPDNLLERRLLGEIYATSGLTGAAEQVFLQCLAAAPDDTLIEERLTALRAGTFAKFRILHGFGTPSERLQTRRQRRGFLPL